MNARQAANTERWALEDAAARQGHSCLLCGGRVPAFEVDGELHAWELCSACNAAFSAAADRVAAATAARLEGPAAAAVVQLVGQLELDDLGQVCLCGHDQEHHDQDLRDGPGDALEGEAPIICRHCICELYEEAGQ